MQNKEHPILFSAPMVRAILKGKKTQTRRVIRTKMDWRVGDTNVLHDGFYARFIGPSSIYNSLDVKCPYGKVGDRLWVKLRSCSNWTVPLSERMRERIVERTGCWLWMGNRNRKGYGFVEHQGKYVMAHRWAWECAHGTIPEGMHVMHSCDSPGCTNPEHLSIGTNQDNIHDKVAKNRASRQCKGEGSQAKLTDTAVLEMRHLRSQGWEQAALASRYGIHQSQVSRVLSGKRWVESIQQSSPDNSRITLEITEIRVQRLQEISEKDAHLEGVCYDLFSYECEWMTPSERGRKRLSDFEAMWDSINAKKHPWESNPWVWVLTFKQVEGPIGETQA